MLRDWGILTGIREWFGEPRGRGGDGYRCRRWRWRPDDNNTNDSRNTTPDQHPPLHLITMRPKSKRASFCFTLDMHPPAWRKNRSNRGNLFCSVNLPLHPEPPMYLQNLISTPFPLLAAPETQHRTYLVPRLSSRSFPPIPLQFRLRADHRRLRMSTGGSFVLRQPVYTPRTMLVGQFPILVSTIRAWQPFLVPRIPTAKSFLYLSLASQPHSFAATPFS